MNYKSIEEIKAIQAEVRNDESAQSNYLREIVTSGAVEHVSLMIKSDKEWIKDLAMQGDAFAACCLVWGITENREAWEETVIDEESQEPVTFVQFSPKRGVVWDNNIKYAKIRKTVNLIEAKATFQPFIDCVEKLSHEELYWLECFARMTKCNYHPFLQELYSRNDIGAKLRLRDLYLHGDRSLGIKCDKQRAHLYHMEFMAAIKRSIMTEDDKSFNAKKS